jgi:hypothetical protein
MMETMRYSFVCEHCGKNSDTLLCAANPVFVNQGKYSSEFNGKCPHCGKRQSWEERAHRKDILYFSFLFIVFGFLLALFVSAPLTGFGKYESALWDSIIPFLLPFWFILCPILGLLFGLAIYLKIVFDGITSKIKNKPIIYGLKQGNEQIYPQGYVPKKHSSALLLCIFLGICGGHRFYVGKIWTAILMWVTVGGCGIWYIIDLIRICTGKFTDSEGYPLKKNDKTTEYVVKKL